MKNWLHLTSECFKKCSYWVGAILAWLAICGFLLIAIFIFSKPYISRVYQYNYAFIETEADKIKEEEFVSIQKLMQKNMIVPVSTVYEDTLKYYEDIITMLIAFFGLFAFVSWFFLGGRMRENLHKELQSKWFDIYLSNKVTTFLKDNLSDYLAEELDRENIRRIAREEFEVMRNKVSDEIQEENRTVLKVACPTKRPATKNKGDK